MPILNYFDGLPVDDDGKWEGQDEDAEQSTQTTHQLAGGGLRLQLVAHRGEGHQGVPERVQEGPLRGLLLHKICHGRYLCESDWL